jgi:DNA invertase Pin-like site-specific DNA recombinase
MRALLDGMRGGWRNWKERLMTAAHVIPDRIRYTRKSTEAAERQRTSHEQQGESCDNKWGPIDAWWWWMDDRSGTTFDRPAFQDMLAFCRANPRSKKAPGTVELYDPSRFGRILDIDGQPDLTAYRSMVSEFERLNWQLHFVKMPRTGNMLADDLTMAIFAWLSAMYSSKLSEDVKRGLLKHIAEGWWVHGQPPWGTKRMVKDGGRILRDNEAANTGGGGIILVPDASVLEQWHCWADRLLAGVSLNKIGEDAYSAGARGPRGGSLGHSTIKNFLANPALIGRLEYDKMDSDGNPIHLEFTAQWPPMVDVAKFHAVRTILASAPAAKRKRKEIFPVTPICAQCGAKYVGGRLGKKQGGARTYVHQKAPKRGTAEELQRLREHGCRAWNVDCEELENAIRDLIVRERVSDDFEAELRSFVLEHAAARNEAGGRLEALRQERKRLEAALRRKQQSAEAADVGDGLAPDDVRQIKALAMQVAAAKRTESEEEANAQSAEASWVRIEQIIHETRNLAAAWTVATPEDRKAILDYWVHDVLIGVAREPGKKKANRKVAFVRLRREPDQLKWMDVGGQRSNARRTSSSASTSSRAGKSVSEPAGAIMPSAQAACDRTRGSGSDSAATNAGTSSCMPTLPSTTAELRRKPRSLARFIGDPLYAPENSDCDIASSSRASERASLPASAGLAAYGDPSANSAANLRLYGHTS